MKKTYFVVSDIHSFYTYLINSLSEAGFDINNNHHILIVCGDIFDRGDESEEVYKFLRSIPKSRRIMIKGNHEELFLELVNKELPERHDYSNGTVKTFCQLSGIIDYKEFEWIARYASFIDESNEKIAIKLWKRITDRIKKSPVYKWLTSDEFKNYYELNEYIFTHSFLPCQIKEEYKSYYDLSDKYPIFQAEPEQLELLPNWRECINEDIWYSSRWVCPWLFYKEGLFFKEAKNNKILVCGHWRTIDFFLNLNESKAECIDPNSCPIYYGKNIIALDTCTVLNKKVNVLKIEAQARKK